MEQEWALVRGSVLEVPELLLEERGVLGVDAGAFVERDVHALGGMCPFPEFVLLEVQPRDHPGVRGGIHVGE